MTSPILAMRDGAVSPAAIEAAMEALALGRPVAIPTDTVYGLAADPLVPGAVEGLFELKGRPRVVNVPLLVTGAVQASGLAGSVTDVAERLMERFWPGPLTLVLSARADLDANLGADRSTVGVRNPDHPVALALCHMVGPLATTSANRHGEPALTTAGAVLESLGGGLGVVLDGGTCSGAPSTVVGCTGDEPVLLREGRLPWSEVLAALNL